jgi:hypothetical protein
MIFKEKLEDYTESEFLELLRPAFSSKNNLTAKAFEKLVTKIVLHIEKITEHPERYAVVTRPPIGREDSPEGVLQEVKRWRAENNKPGFKTS